MYVCASTGSYELAVILNTWASMKDAMLWELNLWYYTPIYAFIPIKNNN